MSKAEHDSDKVVALLAAVDYESERSLDERLREVDALAADGMDMNVPGPYGLRALHKAVSSSARAPLPEMAMIEKLIALGADVNIESDARVRPIDSAIAGNDTDPDEVIDASMKVIELLRAHGAKSSSAMPVSHRSCCAPRMLSLLLDIEGSIELRDGEGNTPLHMVVRTQRPKLVELLLERGADVAAVNHEGLTPLGLAGRGDEYSPEQRKNKAAIIALLENHGAPAQGVIEAGDDTTPLPVDELAARAQEASDLDVSVKEFFQQGLVTGQLLAREIKNSLCDCSETLEAVRFLREVVGEGQPRSMEGDQSFGAPFFHLGDLEIRGHARIVAPFIVTGRLTVEGCISDCGPDSFVVVHGDVRCEALNTSGEFHVNGDIDARQAVYGYYNDNVLCASTIRSRLVIEDEHAVEAKVESPHHYDMGRFRQGRGEGVQEELRAILVPEIFGEEEEGESMFQSSRLFERIRSGEPVFK